MAKHRSSFDGSRIDAVSRLYSIKNCQAYLAENMRPKDKVKAAYYLQNMEIGDNADKFYELSRKYAWEEDN